MLAVSSEGASGAGGTEYDEEVLATVTSIVPAWHTQIVSQPFTDVIISLLLLAVLTGRSC